MAASRRRLEALLARVQQRAAEPRRQGVSATLELVRATVRPSEPTLEVHSSEDVLDEDIEEYDEELIEIIDDADVIPQAAAAARAIEPAAYGAALDRRSASVSGSKVAASAPASQRSAPAPASQRAVAAQRPVPAGPALRGESVSPRPVAPTQVVLARGVPRDLRATSFLELLDASLKLGS